MTKYILMLRDSGFPPDLSPAEIQAILGRYKAWSQKAGRVGGEKLKDAALRRSSPSRLRIDRDPRGREPHSMSEAVRGMVDHLFRRSAGRMVATLTRILGAEHLSLAEEVVQDALVSALQTWSMRGVPDDPAAWLFSVARNPAIDQLRRSITLRDKEPQLVAELRDSPRVYESGFAHEPAEDELRMMLMCCHPSIPVESRIALTLKTVCAFRADEIARAFLTKSNTIAQRIVRAKRMIRDEPIAIEHAVTRRAQRPARVGAAGPVSDVQRRLQRA